ncbi:Small GTPase [Dillenia turbinata]|uniref:Small GTPase n=1 Tax=Dillenia turbinata TaxID=194707 RepID=A0AAN8ZHN4_9MAGN
MHLYNAWLPPSVAEETKKEKDSFALVVKTVKESYRPYDPESVYTTQILLHYRPVYEKKARTWCASKGNIPYFKTSAKEGTNVEEAFQVIAKNAIKSGEEEEMRGQQLQYAHQSDVSDLCWKEPWLTL